MSTPHVKLLSGREKTWLRTSLTSILSLAPSPTARLLWHLQRVLHQAASHATACAWCLKLLEGEGGFMIALEECFAA